MYICIYMCVLYKIPQAKLSAEEGFLLMFKDLFGFPGTPVAADLPSLAKTCLILDFQEFPSPLTCLDLPSLP